MTRLEYEELRDRGLEARSRGDLKVARRLLESARDAAADLAGEAPGLLDQAEVNLAMIRVQLHEDDAAEKGLREVLLRSGSDDIVRLAAHCLAKILSHRQEHEKALRYARLSRERAEVLGDPFKLFAAAGLLGALHLNQSYLEDSLSHYEEAVRLLGEHRFEDPAEAAFYWGMALDNVGYVLVLLGRLEEGKLHLEDAHERASRFGITDLVAETAIDLCFAALQAGDLGGAVRYGERALEIAERNDLTFFRRNCYYLLGEAASRRGDEEAADRYFAKLGEFYPQIAFLGEFLKEFDVSQMINLKEFA